VGPLHIVWASAFGAVLAYEVQTLRPQPSLMGTLGRIDTHCPVCWAVLHVPITVHGPYGDTLSLTAGVDMDRAYLATHWATHASVLPQH
jgi:hypothetical protein